MIRTPHSVLFCTVISCIFLGVHVDSTPIRKQTATDLGVIGVNQVAYGNGTVLPNVEVYMQITISQSCYASFTVMWDAETSLRSDVDFAVANADNKGVILGISERIPEASTFIMDTSRADFGNGTFYVKVHAYNMFVPSVPFTLTVQTSSTSFCPLTDDQYENNQAPEIAPEYPALDKNLNFVLCNDDWFTLDIKEDLIYVTFIANETGSDPDFWILDNNYETIFESNTQGDEIDILVALTDSPKFYIVFFESGTDPSNYTYKALIDVQNKSSKSKDKTALIAGLAVGLGVAAIGVAVGGFFLFRRLRANKYRKTVNQFVDTAAANSTSHYDELALQNSSFTDTNYASIARKSQVERADVQRTVFSKKTRDNYEIDYSELKIIKEIGKGSFGVVYMAQWRQTTVAVKQLKISQMFNDVEKGMQDFRREAELLKSLRPHPNVVLFLGITTEPLSIVIEYCDGGSLVALLRDTSKPVTFDMQVKILLGIARGMLHLHRENIIHRDLAARNILLGQDYVAKVSDFGLSRERRSSVQDKTQSTIGPLKWMSPEAIQNQVFSYSSDVWSFGVVVWEVLERVEPFPTLDAVNAAMKVCYEGLRLPIPQDCHPTFDNVMRSCWDLDPSSRPSFEQICDDLAKLQPKKMSSAPKPMMLSESQSGGSMISLISGNESSGSVTTTYTSARRSDLQPNATDPPAEN